MPASNEEAAQTFNELYDRYIESDSDVPPTEHIREFVRVPASITS